MLAVVAYSLFEMSPFARHADLFRDPMTGKRIGESPGWTDDQMSYYLAGSIVGLNGRPHYLHSGWFLISVANLVVIVAMIAVFVLAIALPFPR